MINYPEWYKLAPVKFNIIKYTYRRETMFIKAKHSVREGKTTRMIRIHNVQHLDLWLKSMQVFKHLREYNLYYSLAKYEDGIPYGSLDLGNRDFGNWVEENHKQIVSYDFLLDIDCGNHKEMPFAYISAKKLKNFFDKNDVPYHLRFSGMGFHFIIPFKCFIDYNLSFNPDENRNIYEFFMDIAMKLHNRFSEMIDLRIYDSRRVAKIPYSLALFDNDNYVCYPFKNNEDFEIFKLEYMQPIHFLNKVDNEPEYMFNEKGNVNKLLKDLRIKTGVD